MRSAVPGSGLAFSAALLGLGLLCMGCEPQIQEADPPRPRFSTFQREIYPQLARDCGSLSCHGNEGRFFQVYAPGRLRLGTPEGGARGACSCEEVCATYERARAMILPSDLEGSPLLLKPLEPDQQGFAHMGVDAFGRDVYPDQENEDWLSLRGWVVDSPREEDFPCSFPSALRCRNDSPACGSER